MILDTNALSALIDGDPGLAQILRIATRCAIPVITLGEYRFGIRQSRHHATYEEWLRNHLGLYEILTITEATTIHYAELRLELRQKGRPLPSNDVWIAALARQYAEPVLSRDLHFDEVSSIRRIGW